MEIKDILDYVTWTPRNNNVNVLKTMLETLIEEYSISDIDSVEIEDILKYVELTPYNSNVNVLKIMLESLISPEPVIEDEAYAVFDSADGSLVFFRDESGKYSEGQVIDTKTYYVGVETKDGNFGWLSNNTSVTNVNFNDNIKPISTTSWFSLCEYLTEITGLDKLDTSNVTDMSSMFSNCRGLTSLDVSEFNTSKVTNMGHIFQNCESLATLDISGFNTSNVDNMSDMFDHCQSLTSLDVSGFDTSNVTTMMRMFNQCNSLTSLDLSGFDTSNDPNMYLMFAGCNSLTTDITINDISLYTEDTFNEAATNPPAKITLYGEGDVTSADIDALITEIKADSPDSNIVNGMQTNTEAYAVFDSADGSLVFFRDEPEKYTEGQIIDTKTYYTGIESGSRGWEDKASNITTATFNDVISPISTEGWFYQCINLISVNSIDNLDTTNLTSTSSMFFNAKELDTLNLDNFDTSGISNMQRMFFGCRDLTTTIILRNQNAIYDDMCTGAATSSNALLTLKYASPVTSDIVDNIIANAGSAAHVVNGGSAQ